MMSPAKPPPPSFIAPYSQSQLMSKRVYDDEPAYKGSARPSRKPKIDYDHLSVLSDELILRILHHVPVESLAICSRVSQRLRTLANDPQIWKAAYFDRFLRPRLQKLAKRRLLNRTATSPARRLPSRLARWLDEDGLVRRGTQTNWKRQYKVRDNWSKGHCVVEEIPLAAPPPPSLLAKLHADTIITADRDGGLRAWTYKSDRALIATHPLVTHSGDVLHSFPTSLAIDESTLRGPHSSIHTKLAVGFDDGSFGLYIFNRMSNSFTHQYTHPASSNDRVASVALSSPHFVSMSQSHTLSLYQFDSTQDTPPRLLTSLKSHSIGSLYSLTLQSKQAKIWVCIAFGVPSLAYGWSTGVQELHISPDGLVEQSRMASSEIPRVLAFPTSPARHPPPAFADSHSQRFGKPTSMSYSHPYLLISHADNTLTLYLVNSSENDLSISPGKRLWGHTSSVFGAQVGVRGKAVSVSSRGDEIRVWELEDTIFPRKKSIPDEARSIQIRPDKKNNDLAIPARTDSNVTGLEPHAWASLEHAKSESSVTKCWVGFDEENVVVVRERDDARQALAVYDFT